jgi:hypothetical protein
MHPLQSSGVLVDWTSHTDMSILPRRTRQYLPFADSVLFGRTRVPAGFFV